MTFTVFFKNWRGEWTRDRKFTTMAAAKRRAQTVAKTKAANGRVAVQS